MKNEIIDAIFKAYGLPESAMVSARVRYLEGWIKKYQFQKELYIYACELTMQRCKKSNNKYTEYLLNRWRMKGVRSLNDAKNIELANAYPQGVSYNTPVKQDTYRKSEASGTRMFRNFTERQNNNYMEKVLQKYR